MENEKKLTPVYEAPPRVALINEVHGWQEGHRTPLLDEWRRQQAIRIHKGEITEYDQHVENIDLMREAEDTDELEDWIVGLISLAYNSGNTYANRQKQTVDYEVELEALRKGNKN